MNVYKFLRQCLLAVSVLLAVYLQACSGGDETLPEVKLDVKRLDIALKKAGAELDKPNADSLKVYNTYFAEDRNLFTSWFFLNRIAYIYRDSILQFTPDGQKDSLIVDQLTPLCKDSSWRQLADSVIKVFPENYDFVSLFQKPMQRLKKRLPNFNPPKIRTFIIGPDIQIPWQYQMQMYQIHLSKEYLGICLNYFAGENFYIYPMETPIYIRKRCKPEYMPAQTFKLMSEVRMPSLTPANLPTFMDYMVYFGIQYYFIETALPDTPDSLKLIYTAPQTEWAKKNVSFIYNELLPLFYERNSEKFYKLLNDGPYTSELSQEAPPRIGHYLGFQIVKAYMQKHSEVSLAELLQKTDYQTIFKESGYKP